MIAVINRPSPNHNQRDPSIPLQYIILHYTGMATRDEALARLCDPLSKVSAHYLIDESGQCYQLVDDAHRAWHAGESFWQGISDINSASLGIELVNPGHQGGYRSFTSPQIQSLKILLRELVDHYNLNPHLALLGHSDISPDRKEDPGELFPWQDLAQTGLGLWPTPQEVDYGSADDAEVQSMLRALGYKCTNTNTYDRSMRATLLAFQRHYEPNNLTGTPELETIARLRALLRLMKIDCHPQQQPHDAQ